MENPIVGDGEVGFIKEQISILIQVAAQMGPDAVVARPSSNNGGNWIGKYPHLRLIHAIIDHNEIKRAYLDRLDVPSGRMALENRNTVEARSGNVWEMVAKKWNDPLYLPVTSVKEHTHFDFSCPLALSFESVSTLKPATADKVAER